MSSEWPYLRIGEIGTVTTGKTPSTSKPENFDGAFPFITIPDLGQGRDILHTARSISNIGAVALGNTKIPAKAVLMSCIATIGKTGITTKPSFTNQQINSVICGTGVIPEFLYYVFCQLGPEIEAAGGGGSVFTNVSKSKFSDVRVPVPPLPVQRNIVNFLTPIDDRITLLRETNTTLEAIAQALFKSWFVDFDPVHAKMQGRAPEGMDEATAALFPDSFEESELGAVPKGWKLVPFGQLLSHTIGGDWGSDVADEKNDTRVAIIRGTDIPDLQSNANSRVPVRYTSQKKLAGRKLEDGDLLLEVSGGSKDQPTGRSLYLSAALLSQFDCPVEPASFCRLLRPLNKEVGMLLAQHLTYIYAQGKTWEYQNQSTGIANFQTTHFLETELVACPPDDVLKAFAETVQPLIARAHLTQIQELASLQDTLLPRLISGQLRISDVKTITDAER
jgi:type I restriction enzyme S subunit